MKFRMRKTVRVWPLFWTFTERGYSSWGFKAFRFTWNFTRGTKTFDTPGPGYVRWGGRR